MTGTRGVGDGRVWVEGMPLGRVSLQVNEPSYGGGIYSAEAVLSTDEAVDLATHLLASVRPAGRFAPETGGATPPPSASAAPELPAHWPPRPGELWRDRGDDTWAVMASGKLVPLANDIDNHPKLWLADEVESKLGPLKRVREVVKGSWDGVPF